MPDRYPINPPYLARWREAAGLTQAKVGEHIGVTAAQISRVETGKRDWDGKYLTAFAGLIGCTLPELFVPPLFQSVRLDALAKELKAIDKDTVRLEARLDALKEMSENP